MTLGTDNALSSEDQEALTVVLPSAELFGSEFSFYIHVLMLFKSKSLVHHEVLFAQLALSVTPPGVDTVSLWYSIIKGHTDLGLYENAYASLIATPHDKQYVLPSTYVAHFDSIVGGENVLASSSIGCVRRTQSKN